jgi:hypothetical protein
VGDFYGFWALTLLHFQCRQPSKKRPFSCPENGVHYSPALFEPTPNLPEGLEALRDNLVLYLVTSRALAAEVEQRLEQDLRGISAQSIVVIGLYGGTDWGSTDAWITRDQPTILICTFEKGGCASLLQPLVQTVRIGAGLAHVQNIPRGIVLFAEPGNVTLYRVADPGCSNSIDRGRADAITVQHENLLSLGRLRR